MASRNIHCGYTSGIVLSLVLCEAGLRGAARFVEWRQERANAEKLAGTDAMRIVCLGESTTAMGGDDSWPSQLERILNSRFPERKVVVINAGIPGATSVLLVEKARKLSSVYRPDLIIAMMGENDPEKSEQTMLGSGLAVARLWRWIQTSVRLAWGDSDFQKIVDGRRVDSRSPVNPVLL